MLGGELQKFCYSQFTELNELSLYTNGIIFTILSLFRKRKKSLWYIQKTGQKISTKCQQTGINHDFMLNESYYIFHTAP